MATTRNIPSLDDRREISTAQRDEFRDNGHLLVRGLLGAEGGGGIPRGYSRGGEKAKQGEAAAT
ncbi:hypothetical protein ACQ86N_05455 [Puia sp. P3]|uniref:hypothetical protein n=1 Tax=Puia sp. P3 TaxID=3423952 RepID=UPI003D67CD93